MRHVANAAAAAEERERSLLEELWRVRDSEAKAGQEKHARIHTQPFVRCKMWSGPEHDSDVHGDWSVQQTMRST